MATDYISQDVAATIADYAADKHPYDKDTKKPETYSEYNRGWNDACDYIRERLEGEKPADVEPVRHGRKIEDGDIGCFWLCSLCGKCLPYGANYAPAAVQKWIWRTDNGT